MKKILVSGKVHGIILKSKNPINFLGTVDKKTGIITDKNHDLFDKSIKDTLFLYFLQVLVVVWGHIQFIQ